MQHPELYTEINDRVFTGVHGVLEKYSGRLTWKENEKILDIGCGPGKVTANYLLPMLPPTAHLLGCDISPKMIDYAKKNFHNDRLNFTVLDISADITASDLLGISEFDKIFTMLCLHWVSDERKAAENIWNLLKPGGVTLVVFVSTSGLIDIHRILKKNPKWSDYMDVENYTPKYHGVVDSHKIYSDLLQSVGFNVIECYTVDLDFSSSTFTEFKKMLKAIDCHHGKMPSDIQAEYIDCMMTEGIDHGFIKVEQSNNEQRIFIHPVTGVVAFFQK